MKCERCGFDDHGTDDSAHCCPTQKDGLPYVPVMGRNHWPTAQDEMHRLFDECARLGTENAALRALLLKWYALVAPVRREDTEGARLLDRTAKALSSEFRYKTPNELGHRPETAGGRHGSGGPTGSAA